MIVLFTQCKKDPEPVNIPDDAFLTALIELGFDTNGDGEICPCEAEDITYLNVMFRSISDMTGIEAFINLDTLKCGSYGSTEGRQLTSLDVSNNTALVALFCYANQLTSLDVSNNTDLHALWLGEMPSLIKVCVWEIPFPPEGVEVDTTGSFNVYFTTECSK